jgi:hypothetical protein
MEEDCSRFKVLGSTGEDRSMFNVLSSMEEDCSRFKVLCSRLEALGSMLLGDVVVVIVVSFEQV